MGDLEWMRAEETQNTKGGSAFDRWTGRVSILAEEMGKDEG